MRILTLEEYNFFYNWICLKAITVKNKNLVTHSINFNNRLLIQKYLIYVAKRKKNNIHKIEELRTYDELKISC